MSLQPGERKRCEACGEPMVGARTNRGLVAPVVLAPAADGNVLLYRDPGGGEVAAAVLGRADVRSYLHEHGVPLRVVHFRDCPAADQFRRPAEGSA